MEQTIYTTCVATLKTKSATSQYVEKIFWYTRE